LANEIEQRFTDEDIKTLVKAKGLK
jgi:hypothetical protein